MVLNVVYEILDDFVEFFEVFRIVYTKKTELVRSHNSSFTSTSLLKLRVKNSGTYSSRVSPLL